VVDLLISYVDFIDFCEQHLKELDEWWKLYSESAEMTDNWHTDTYPTLVEDCSADAATFVCA